MKLIFKSLLILSLCVFFLPIVTNSQEQTFKEFLDKKIISGILTPVVPLIIAIAIVVFLWGVLKFVRSESEEKRQEGRDFMIWGIVGLFVMISVWGLVGVLSDTFKLDNSSLNVPSLKL